jgi:hypothetical protein
MLERNMRSALIGRAALLAMLVVPVSAVAQQNESMDVLGRPPPLDSAPSSKAGGGLGPSAGAQDARRTEQRRLQEQQRRQQEEQNRWREMLR